MDIDFIVKSYSLDEIFFKRTFLNTDNGKIKDVSPSISNIRALVLTLFMMKNIPVTNKSLQEIQDPTKRDYCFMFYELSKTVPLFKKEYPAALTVGFLDQKLIDSGVIEREGNFRDKFNLTEKGEKLLSLFDNEYHLYFSEILLYKNYFNLDIINILRELFIREDSSCQDR